MKKKKEKQKEAVNGYAHQISEEIRIGKYKKWKRKRDSVCVCMCVMKICAVFFWHEMHFVLLSELQFNLKINRKIYPP